MFCCCWCLHADAGLTLSCFLPWTCELSGASNLCARFAALNIEHSVVGGPPWAKHAHTSENSLISRHTETYTLFPTGTRCLCCVINQSCQIDFTAPSEKRRGSHPTTLKRWKKAEVEELYYYQTWSLDLRNLWRRIGQFFMNMDDRYFGWCNKDRPWMHQITRKHKLHMVSFLFFLSLFKYFRSCFYRDWSRHAV